ncbi:hypothetical protein BJV78DRAFT_344935 [Lactifluus subvellereus]|nr:hypothetical protein BJV78DRAFT_344935 [Lactifluus subvellereus]
MSTITYVTTLYLLIAAWLISVLSAALAREQPGEQLLRVLPAAHAITVGLCIAGNIFQLAAIERLPDELLLKIFSLDRLVSMSLSQSRPWEWHRLVHVCRRWRYIIFDSPLSLDLRLFCTYGTPVKNNLDCWPGLPIVVRYLAFSSPSPLPKAAADEDNIIAALQHPDRILAIQLNVTTPLLERLATLARQPFPALETLELGTQTETGLVLPNESLGGPFPRLRVLHLTRIAFPALQRLLLSAENIVSLKLDALPNSVHISLEALMICLAAMTLLETLHLHFNFPISRSIAGGTFLRCKDASSSPLWMNLLSTVLASTWSASYLGSMLLFSRASI